MYKWLTCYLLKESHDKLQNNLKAGMDPFIARNETQVYYLKNLAIAFVTVLFCVINNFDFP